MKKQAAATDCRRCGASMPPLVRAAGACGVNALPLRITAFRCPRCEHWNNLKRRKANDQVELPPNGGSESKRATVGG